MSRTAWTRDLEAVVSTLALERFDLLGMSQGGPVAVNYAATNPDRVERLVLYGSYDRGRSHRGLSAEVNATTEALLHMIRTGWGRTNPAFRKLFTGLFLPGGDEEQVRWFNELQRVSIEPEMAARIAAASNELDVTDLARAVAVPTLFATQGFRWWRDAFLPV